MKTNCCDCCYPAVIDQDACGCCEGVEIITPVPTYNRPGLSQINYRIGTHAGFLETMTARLTGFYLEKQGAEGETRKFYPLTGLTTRDTADPSLAFLDAWATVADVLTFYQERIANEGYLRTATERRSIVELARLVGYRPRLGVAASVFLAYTIDANTQEEVVIPAGSRAQSIPGPGELPQSFEISEDLKARAQWNNLKPRMTQAQTRSSIESTIEDKNYSRVYLKGLSTNIKLNDALLINFGTDSPLFGMAQEVIPESDWDRTLVTFTEPPPADPPADFSVTFFGKIIDQLVRPASLQPANRYQLRQDLVEQFALPKMKFSTSEAPKDNPGSEFYATATRSGGISVAQSGYTVLGAFSPVLKEYLGKATATPKLRKNTIEVYHLGIKAALFGHNLPLPDEDGKCASGDDVVGANLQTSGPELNLHTLALEAEFQNIKVGARVAIKTNGSLRFATIKDVNTRTLGGPQNGDLAFFTTCPTTTTLVVDGVKSVTVAEPIKMKVTVLTLDKGWRTATDTNEILKNTTVYIQSAKLDLAEEPIPDPVCGGTDDTIVLNGFYDGLEAGKWVIVSGESAEVEGVHFSELAMLASVRHGVDPNLPDESLHTYIQLAEKLAYCFKRDTVTIYGNVVKATHGETRLEVLGSGDGAKALQTFELKQKPLTHVSATKPSGIDSTLKVFVNNIEWYEANSLTELEANDRAFITQTDNDNKTAVIFGNGRKGARLPTGVENIRAQYRNGIGRSGNVRAEQISLLLTKPLGVKEVINPLRALGGTDRETRDQMRRHVPLAVKALDRLVSTQDYEDFSRIFAGVGKAHAIELNDGRLPLIHVTVAGVDDIPIDANSDLLRNLLQALYDFGDPFQKIQLAVRELLMIVIEAGIAILPDCQWESVVTEVRSALLDRFSFERRELGQDVFLSEIISVMQSVRGVAYVDVDAFGGIPEKISEGDSSRRLLTPDEISEAVDCLSTRWSAEDMETYCEDKTAAVECRKYKNCKKYGSFGKTIGVRKHLQVNLAGFENGAIRPAQLAFLSPDVPATLILNQIK